MKKWDFVKMVAERVGLSQQKVNEVLDETARLVIEQCRDNGEDVTFGSLGTFKLKENAPRKGRNPMTGKVIDVKGSKTVQFRAMPSVKVTY